MVELYKLYQQTWGEFNQRFVDPWLENPIAEWWMDQSMDWALKMYYLPFFAATWEDKIKENINSFSICKV